MHANHKNCFFCRNDSEESWKRIIQSANDTTRAWVVEDSENATNSVKAVFCLSIGHLNRPEECETEGTILLSMFQNNSRYFAGVAVERVATPKKMIFQSKKRFIKILPPISQHFLSNEKTVRKDETQLNLEAGHIKGSTQVETRILRDLALGFPEIAALEKMGNWSLAGRTDIGRSTVEA